MSSGDSAHEFGQLLDRARAGDREARSALLKWVRPWLRVQCRRQVYCDDEASDLTQEVQIRMNRGFAGFRGGSKLQLQAWARQIMVRVVIDRYRAKPPPAGPLPPEVPDPDVAEPFAALVDAEDMARLAAALERLPKPYRRVIEARLFDRLSSPEIAQNLGRTEEWVRITCMRAVKRLNRVLGETP
jgi:RNA polymerase sigma-70 factor (ECF subfamily)